MDNNGNVAPYDDLLAVRVRPDNSIEISHMNSRGFRHSKVYYGYPLAEAVSNYKSKYVTELDRL